MQGTTLQLTNRPQTITEKETVARKETSLYLSIYIYIHRSRESNANPRDYFPDTIYARVCDIASPYNATKAYQITQVPTITYFPLRYV